MTDDAVRRYAPTFGEQARGVVAVAIPLGSINAIERLAHDLVAFGYGMGEAAPQSAAQFQWYEKAEAARLALMQNVRAAIGGATVAAAGSVVLAVDKAAEPPTSRSTPNKAEP